MENETRLQELGQVLSQDGPNETFTDIPRLRELGDAMTLHGTQMVTSLALLVIGLLAAKWIDKTLRKGLQHLMPNAPFVLTFCSIVHIILVALVILAAAVEFGAKPLNMIRLVTIISLVVTGLNIFFRPFLPTMPFKAGNTVKIGNLLGKVEAVTFLNTRMKTFDGKTFFVPNRQILNDIVINYHFSTTRKIKVNVGIRYDQDLLKAKRVLEAVMIEDARVKTKPSPVVYALNLASSSVDLGGRCWVDNKDFWVTRCDLVEKIKLRFDTEGIQFAFPQLDLHINDEASRTHGSGCLDNEGMTGLAPRGTEDL